MTASKRQLKFSKLIQQEISAILQSQFYSEFNGKLVSVTDVEMSPDLGLARIYISVFPISFSDDALNLINDKKSKVRGELGRKIGKQVRIVPELAFFLDATAENAQSIDKLLDSLEIPEEGDSKTEED
ncbi:30S ribosome-binding factor RbfA [Roseivirga pacifica]|uniref:30S ribosome-binding factor RbfA n=1 Tax=Roseivirga pacifica TaxID=1267423 RepID=UPI0020953EC1|nr:30S ribosome-binding factor RbfA [Roseivirga pacifica]MCO6359305.1 30S ribosome-binding factor RbfA [Roseivirga pacifica]MCO6366675.1 30S ribosome-binding factor RbfA [Roseivirga pacifica]MCO6370793.1 30S ribosome-binding factor RbfA [Roseivirga pacifica]MCO6374331.1 30S ribosome-binding factor RbfA [Roseivirga pacifica]MCO6379590.1 30S ribosome-binding factor RbfA [Roseivirga pacifica]